MSRPIIIQNDLPPDIIVRLPGTAIPGPPGTFAWVAVPATLSSAGTAGQLAYDSSYLYLCYATNAWMKFVGVA